MNNQYRTLWNRAIGSRHLLPIAALMSLAVTGYLLVGLRAADVRNSNPIFIANEALTNRVKGASSFSPRATVSDVVTKALAFKAMLTATQQQALEQTYTTALARRWSNLPCGATCRNGIQFSTLTADQLAVALEVIKAAMGTTANEGADEFTQTRLADTVLASAQGTGGGPGGGGYGEGIYFLAFLNTPSTTGAWMLQFGGHHYGANIAYNQGHVVGTTPLFEAIEPLTFTVNNVTYSPLAQERDAFGAMLASLTATELSAAKLSQTFSDVTMSPGETNGGNGTFPTTKVGIAVSGLSAAQKLLVLEAMKPWVRDLDDTVATNLLTIYQGELEGTYIAFTGNGVAGDASSFLNANTNYARIDGPSVWIEFACQSGVVFRNQIHYHTVWRDRQRDYGKDLSLTTALDSSSSGSTGSVTSTSGASYAVGALAREAIGTLFGTGLATAAASASTSPLPTALGGVQVQVRDSAGVTRTAPLFYVSPTQVSYQLPSGTSTGAATISVLLNNATVGQGTTVVEQVTPGLFAANSNGQGVAAAIALRVKADGSQIAEPVLQLNSATNKYEALPLSIGDASDQLFLLAFGTGFRNRTSLGAVTATIGGTAAEVAFAAAQGTFIGLDQANIRIPASLAGRGDVNVILNVDGKTSNTVVINVR